MKSKALVVILAVLLALAVAKFSPIAQAAVTQRFVQTPTITLYSSISSSATSMRITPYPKDLSGTKLTMNDFGSSTTATIDPKVKGVEEIVTFTGMTDNGDNTATLTGLTRGMLSKYPYTSGGTAYAHAASAIVVFSNNPQIYGRLASKENDETVTGSWTFNNRPTIPSDTDTAVATAFVTFGQLSRQAISGASNAAQTVKGILQVATALQIASSTPTGSTGALLALTSTSSTSTPNPTLCGFGCIPATQNDGKINPLFIATSSSYTYNWGAIHIFGGLTTFNAAATFNVAPTFGTFSATSTTATSSVSGNLTVAKNASTTNLTVSNSCTGCQSGYEQIYAGAAFQTTNGLNTTAVATCSTGKKVVGGGASSTQPLGGSGVNTYQLIYSYPSATNAWSVQVQCATSGSCPTGTLGAYAICVTP